MAHNVLYLEQGTRSYSVTIRFSLKGLNIKENPYQSESHRNNRLYRVYSICIPMYVLISCFLLLSHMARLAPATLGSVAAV